MLLRPLPPSDLLIVAAGLGLSPTLKPSSRDAFKSSWMLREEPAHFGFLFLFGGALKVVKECGAPPVITSGGDTVTPDAVGSCSHMVVCFNPAHLIRASSRLLTAPQPQVCRLQV